MIPIEQSVDIARATANAIFGDGVVLKVDAAAAKDSEGEEILGITLEVADDFASRMTGDQIADALSLIKSRLESSGEMRRPLIRYITDGKER